MHCTAQMCEQEPGPGTPFVSLQGKMKYKNCWDELVSILVVDVGSVFYFLCWLLKSLLRYCNINFGSQMQMMHSVSSVHLHRTLQDVCSEPSFLRMQNGNLVTWAVTGLHLPCCRSANQPGCKGAVGLAGPPLSWGLLTAPYRLEPHAMGHHWVQWLEAGPVLSFLTFWQPDLH